MSGLPLLWISRPSAVIAAELWPEPPLRLKRQGEQWSTAAGPAGTTDTSLSNLVASLPLPLRERLRPSAIGEHLLCPLRARFKREWEPRGGREWSPALALGNAVHAGVHAHFTTGPESAAGAIEQTLSRDFEEHGRWTYPQSLKLAQKGLQAALGELEGVHVLASEQRLWLGQPDLVAEGAPLGLNREIPTIEIIDVKCHLDQRSERYVDEWAVSPQLWAYAIEAERYYQASVEWFKVLEVIFTPKVHATLVPFHVQPAQKAFMAAMLRQETERIIDEYKYEVSDNKWSLNEGIPTVANTQGCFRFGRCPAFEACHEFQWNPERMTALYIPRDPTTEPGRIQEGEVR